MTPELKGLLGALREVDEAHRKIDGARSSLVGACMAAGATMEDLQRALGLIDQETTG